MAKPQLDARWASSQSRARGTARGAFLGHFFLSIPAESSGNIMATSNDCERSLCARCYSKYFICFYFLQQPSERDTTIIPPLHSINQEYSVTKELGWIQTQPPAPTCMSSLPTLYGPDKALGFKRERQVEPQAGGHRGRWHRGVGQTRRPGCPR